MTSFLILAAVIAAIVAYRDTLDRWTANSAAEREVRLRQATADVQLKIRELELAERKLEIHATRVNRPPNGKPDMIPVDLLQGALVESERWAREDKLKYLQDMREQSGSWDAVRSVVGVD